MAPTSTLDNVILLWTGIIGVDYIKVFFGLIIVFVIVMIFINRFNQKS